MKPSIEHINAKINSFKNDPKYMGEYLISLIDESTEIERSFNNGNYFRFSGD